MLKRISVLFLIIALVTIGSVAVAEPTPNAATDVGTIEKLIDALSSPDRVTWEQAIDQLTQIGLMAVPQLSQAARKKGEGLARWNAVNSLARIKAPESKPLLIELLRDEDSSIRGAACWGLSQIGGQDVSDVLLEFLRTSLEQKNWSDVQRATEAQRELPDKRAVPLLITCLDVIDKSIADHSFSQHAAESPPNYSFSHYAADALGKIGDPSASEALAKQLDLSVEYSASKDPWFLAAIAKTKGDKAVPYLVHYLVALVEKMRGQEIPEGTIGREARQTLHNISVYYSTLSALEAITKRKSGRKSDGATREETAENWSAWLKEWEKNQAKQ